MASISSFGRTEALQYVRDAFARITSSMGTPYEIMATPPSYYRFFSGHFSPISFNFFGGTQVSSSSRIFSSIPSPSASGSSSTPSKKRKGEEVLSRIALVAGLIVVATASILVGKSVYRSFSTRKEALKESEQVKNLLDSGDLDPLFNKEHHRKNFEAFVDTNLKIDQIRYDRFSSALKTVLGVGIGSAALTHGLYTENHWSETTLHAGEGILVASMLYGAWKILSHSDDHLTLAKLRSKIVGSHLGCNHSLGKGLAQEAYESLSPRFSFTTKFIPSEPPRS